MRTNNPYFVELHRDDLLLWKVFSKVDTNRDQLLSLGEFQANLRLTTKKTSNLGEHGDPNIWIMMDVGVDSVGEGRALVILNY